MDGDAWRDQLPKLKDLLRVPVDESAGGVRVERAAQVESLHRDIAELVFSGAQDWLDRDDGWLSTRLAGHDAELHGLLASGDDAVTLAYLADVCVPAWRAAASAQGAGEQSAGDLVGEDNSANWAANRIPGTLYFILDGAEYRYSDHERAQAASWRTIDEREQEATIQAQTWGKGWCTGAGDDPRYGGEYVFSTGRHGPWLPQTEVEHLLAAGGDGEGGATDAAAQPWESMWIKLVDGEWRYGLTEQGPWSYDDGPVALREKAILDDVTATLLAQYPDADVDYVHTMAAHFVAETSGGDAR
jgi:hypothetical protein